LYVHRTDNENHNQGCQAPYASPSTWFPRSSLPSNDAVCPPPVRHFPSLQEEGNATWFARLWQERRLGSGVVLTVFDAALPKAFSLEFCKNNPLIDFGFFLEGAFTNRIDSLPGAATELQNKAGQFGVGYLPEMCGSAYFPARQKTRFLHVHVLPSMLGAMLGRDAARVSPCLRKVLESERAGGFVHQHRLTPLMQTVANELFYSVRNAAGIEMYVEAKVWELLALVVTGGPSACSEGPLCPRVCNVMHAIRDELELRHAAPPTLSEISAAYHMPIANIQAGFKALFGMSVIAFVREYRLQRARTLFAEGDMNVSEVAWGIGYTNLSHFSSAYRKRFGVLPKAYLRSVREHLHTPSR